MLRDEALSGRDERKWRFAVDQGGTFTDVVGLSPERHLRTLKLLSRSPQYESAPIEGIRRILSLSEGEALPSELISEIRFGTTVATNALLERKGGRVGLLITRGFSDLLEIGSQSRPRIFDLCIRKPEILYTTVCEVDERIGQDGQIVTPLDPQAVARAADRLKRASVDAVAVVLLHAWKNPAHELLCERVLGEQGIPAVFLSHQTLNLIKVVSRGQSTVVNAYLSSVIGTHIEGIRKATGEIPITFMLSSGGLAHPEAFRGKDALLSGPAGGVVAVASMADALGAEGVIGFDMGGTSTDVCRYEGELEQIYETVLAGVELQTEMLNIVTVASGGGSLLWFDGQRMRVGPESAGADPGPACYGFGGPLTVTDANLLVGRIVTDYFPETFGEDRKSPINGDLVQGAFRRLTDRINGALQREMSSQEVALGFLRIANETMAMAIKEISVSKGVDVRNYGLVCFGGAAGQHACQLAAALEIDRVIFHPLSSLLSAYGIGLAHPVHKAARTVLKGYDPRMHQRLKDIYASMETELLLGAPQAAGLSVTRRLDLRHAGSDTSFTLEYLTHAETLAAFAERYQRVYGFYPEGAALEVVNVRLEVAEKEEGLPAYVPHARPAKGAPEPVSHQTLHHVDGARPAPVYLRERLAPGAVLNGPCLVLDPYTTVVVDPGFKAEMLPNGILLARRVGRTVPATATVTGKPDPVLLEVFNNLFRAVATEMGHTLRNTAHSVNIKERLDFSCAVFDKAGGLVANAPHIPVHLGSMGDTVKAVMQARAGAMQRGDMYLTNNPYKGGSHLPDTTVVCPVFSTDGELRFFTAARGHHADMGGVTPGSMPAEVADIAEEGVLIDNLLLVRGGVFQEADLTRCLCDSRYPVRHFKERLFDLQAQIAACRKGEAELHRLIKRYGWATVRAYMGFVQENASFAVKQALSRFLQGRDTFDASFEDRLDDGTPLRVHVQILAGERSPQTLRAVIDFSGTGSYHRQDNLNAPLSVTRSAVLYAIRSLTGADIPLNAGCLQPVEILVPQGSLLNPQPPAPVASGNVETSQRIVDVLLGALQVAGASQGTMNNLLFEVQGETPYYETIAGGSGALEDCPGASGVQVHMTNTRITDPEILEVRHPGVRLARFTLRKGSGGGGRWPGGDGVIREVIFLKPATVSILSERRAYPPYGMRGGAPGQPGRNLLVRRGGEVTKLPHRVTLRVEGGERIVLETPGGGGFGPAL
jgi:5-oxoprolinase (ATP-hydrolysing)